MYAREKASEESQNNLLEEIEITVSKNGVVLDVMNAGVNDKGVNLGSFKTGDEVELEVALNIPITLGNRITSYNVCYTKLLRFVNIECYRVPNFYILRVKPF